MTAIKKYARLEATGLWRDSENFDFIEVLISFGKTSIILSDYKDKPLTHWSLTAIKLVSRDQNEATFSTDSDDGECLLIKDADMIESLLLFINKDEQKSNTTKIKFYICFFFLIVSSIALIVYFPSKIKVLTASVISNEIEQQLIEPFVDKHVSSSGGSCSSLEIETIKQRILTLIEKDKQTLSVIIIRDQKMNALHLPNGVILISSAFLNNATNEFKLVALLEQELPSAINRKPLNILINQQTTVELIRFLLGFDTQLHIKEINDFLTPATKPTLKKQNLLDDFSWVTLQNACLN